MPIGRLPEDFSTRRRQHTRVRVLLVGATGVIGRAIHASLRDSHEVVTAGLDDPQVRVDIGDPKALQETLDRIGPIDALISTAGRARFAALASIEPASLADSVYGLGLTDKLLGQVNLALAARRVLRPGGSITLTSGTTSETPVLGGSSFSMVNGALEAWARAVATELPNGWRINVVSPSLVEGTPAQALAVFPGFELVSGQRVALAYLRCLQSGISGQVIRV